MKNPLIPMAAITGNPTKAEINEVMHLYAQAGIEQFLIYPRSGLEIEYMSERWIEICGNIIEAAIREKIDVWLYDEFFCPSGTCRGKVMRENEEYCAKSVFVENGKCVIKKYEKYADILNPDAVECFIQNTHEVYYKHFGQYFGTVIKGIFTDEPDMWACTWNGGKYAYTKDLDVIYREKYQRDLFEDMSADKPSERFKRDYTELLSDLFRTNFLKRINDWCVCRNVVLMGHTMSELNVCQAVRTCGNTIKALRCFSLPGMDEIRTQTSISKAEWLTLGCTEAAIRTVGNGGMAELFALGPTDIPPARIEQMIWLTAMFKVDRYVLAVSALDARGNVEKGNYYNPMCYTNPWFEGYKDFSACAKEAARYAQKTFAPHVVVRYPVNETVAHLFTEKEELVNDRLCELLRALVKNQYQWQMIDQDEAAATSAYLVEIDATDDFSVSDVISDIKKSVERNLYVLENGALADELLVREYDDGSFLILDLKDSNQARELTVMHNGIAHRCRLCGRGHFTSDDKTSPEFEVQSLDNVSFEISLDSANVLRCAFYEDACAFDFYAEEDIDGISIAVRNYHFDGEIFLDGNRILSKNRCNGLKKGFNELYLSTDAFTIKRGAHKITSTKAAVSEFYLPTCFLMGNFASDQENRLRSLPKTVSSRHLEADVLPQYAGAIAYETEIDVPLKSCKIGLESADLYTRLYIEGECLGARWNDYIWDIPHTYCGKRVKLKIVQYTTVGPIFGNVRDCVAAEKCHRWLYAYAPGNYHKIGVTNMRFVMKDERKNA